MTMAIFDKNEFLAIRHVELSKTLDHLPPHVYRLTMTMEGPNLIRHEKKFKIPNKIYGKHHSYLNRILKDYKSNSKPLGVLLYGMAGTGKTLLAEDLVNHCLMQDIPAIMISEPIPAPLIRDIIKMVGPCVVYFDEVGKNYNEHDDRIRLINLFSDSSLGKVLFVATGNIKEEFPNYCFNRPGRFKYAIEYGSIDVNQLNEIMQEYGIRPDVQNFMRVYIGHATISIDTLLHLMSEIFDCINEEEVIDVMSILNVPKPPLKGFKFTSARIKLVNLFNNEVIFEDATIIHQSMSDTNCFITMSNEEIFHDELNITFSKNDVVLDGNTTQIEVDGPHCTILLSGIVDWVSQRDVKNNDAHNNFSLRPKINKVNIKTD